jgi:hypothetical protein
MTEKKQIWGAIQDTLVEVQEILAKSGYGDMAKDDQMPPEAGTEGGEAPPPPTEGGEDGGEMPPEAGAEDQGEDPAQALAEQAKQLTDEELDHMIEALMTEKESRHGGEGQGEGAPMPQEGSEGMPSEAPSGDEAEKSMKSEFASLAKSMNGIADAVGKLTKEVTDLKAAKPAARVAAKPAVSSKAQVLEKSAPVKGRLNKSDTITFVLNEQRAGNRNITREDVAEINLARNAQELAAVQDRLSLAGVKFPEK